MASMKATVQSNSPGVGQLFANPPKSFGSLGAAALHLLRGLVDPVNVLIEVAGNVANIFLLSGGSSTGGFSTWDAFRRFVSTATPTTRTAYDWTAEGVGGAFATVTAPSDPVSLQALIDFIQGQIPGDFALVIDQIEERVLLSNDEDVAGSMLTLTKIPVATLSLTSGSAWE